MRLAKYIAKRIEPLLIERPLCRYSTKRWNRMARFYGRDRLTRIGHHHYPGTDRIVLWRSMSDMIDFEYCDCPTLNYKDRIANGNRLKKKIEAYKPKTLSDKFLALCFRLDDMLIKHINDYLLIKP